MLVVNFLLYRAGIHFQSCKFRRATSQEEQYHSRYTTFAWAASLLLHSDYCSARHAGGRTPIAPMELSLRRSSTVVPETEEITNIDLHTPDIAASSTKSGSLDSIPPHLRPNETDSPRTARQKAMLLLPRVNMNIRKVPHMMNLNAYMPTVKPPAFLKEIYTIPIQMTGHINKEMHRMGHNINKLIDRSDVYLRTPPPMPEFNNCSILSTLFSMFNYALDLGSDIAVAYVLWFEPDTVWWFWLTVSLIVFPTLVLNAFSLYWYVKDDYEHSSANTGVLFKRPRMSKCWWIFVVLMHVIQLGPLTRHLDMLYYGIKSRQSRLQSINVEGPYCPWPKQRKEFKKQADYYNLLLHEERDISMLDLLHSFTQDAPQLVLQIYILVKRPPLTSGESDLIQTILVQVGSTLISLCSLSWSLTSYQRAIRYAMPDKPNLSVGGSIFHFNWHAFTIAARVVALSLFVAEYKVELAAGLALHWAIMTLWIVSQKTSFCGTEDGEKNLCGEFIYNAIMGWVYVFCMINVKDAPTRLKYGFYYTVLFVENCAMVTLWYLTVLQRPDGQRPWYHIPSFAGVISSFVLGMLCMLIYYRHYHPDGKMPLRDVKFNII